MPRTVRLVGKRVPPQNLHLSTFFGYWDRSRVACWLHAGHGPVISVISQHHGHYRRWFASADGRDLAPDGFRSPDEAMGTAEGYRIAWHAERLGGLAPAMARQAAVFHRGGDRGAFWRAVEDSHTPLGAYCDALTDLYAALHACDRDDGPDLARQSFVTACSRTLDRDRSEELAELMMYQLGWIEWSERRGAAPGTLAAKVATDEWVLFDPRMDDLRARLSALLAACKAGGGDPLEPTTAAAIKSVEDAVSDALDCGCEVALVRSTLDDWTKATGGPRITITGERPPAR